MPTESTFLFAGLLFLAAALGYVFARFGDTDEEEEAEEKTRASFLRGFRYLVNEESDRAVDVFTGVGDLSEEAMETQLALGTLFRRRGEMDRAIRLHQNLVERASSTPAQRESASFALAEDYLSAGLFDRAEELFIRLRDSRVHGPEAVRRLLRICEVTSDWDRAVDLCAELNRLDPGGASTSQLAHYYCELAEQARRAQAPDDARRLLDQAQSIQPGSSRASLIRSDLDRDAGRIGEAMAALTRLGLAEPGLMGLILPRLLTMAAAGHRALVAAALRDLATTSGGLQGLALAVIRDDRLTDTLAVQYLTAFLAGQEALRPLLAADGPGASPSPESVQLLRPFLARVLGMGDRYQCSNCGYGSAVLHWQCPGCRSWDTLQPATSTALEGLVS
jgi:lipopolysaccharide biosynthesis regulator YciM